jgi:hypothetical protein
VLDGEAGVHFVHRVVELPSENIAFVLDRESGIYDSTLRRDHDRNDNRALGADRKSLIQELFLENFSGGRFVLRCDLLDENG